MTNIFTFYRAKYLTIIMTYMNRISNKYFVNLICKTSDNHYTPESISD